jgi:AraC-like DNA-binding protein/mannose-6-phosphate isomerase-like protein (cupin superfamily)
MLPNIITPGIHAHHFPREKAKYAIELTINDLLETTPYNAMSRELHAHRYFEIFLFEKGGGRHIIDNTAYELKDRHVHIVQPGIIHLVQRNNGTRGKVLLFSFDASLGTNSMLSDSLIWFYRNPLIHPVSHLSEAAFAKLQQLVELMQAEDTGITDAGEHRAYICSLFSAFLLTLKHNFTGKQQPGNDRMVSDFIKLVDHNYHEGLSIGDYAQKLNISEKTLCREVKKQTALTPARIVRERVMLEACRLLANTNLIIKEIAYQLHFSDTAHFTRVFKQEKHCTPQEYRKGAQSTIQ